MVDLTVMQKEVLTADGPQLVVGGPGSGKTTVSILKAAKIARDKLRPGQRILFLSFARATVSRFRGDRRRAVSHQRGKEADRGRYLSLVLLAHSQDPWLFGRVSAPDDDPDAAERSDRAVVDPQRL